MRKKCLEWLEKCLDESTTNPLLELVIRGVVTDFPNAAFAITVSIALAGVIGWAMVITYLFRG